MFGFLKTTGLLKVKMCYIAILIIIWYLMNDKEKRLQFNSSVFVCQFDKGSVVLVHCLSVLHKLELSRKRNLY